MLSRSQMSCVAWFLIAAATALSFEAQGQVWARVGKKQDLEALWAVDDRLWTSSDVWPLADIKNFAENRWQLPSPALRVLAATKYRQDMVFGTDRGIWKIDQDRLVEMVGAADLRSMLIRVLQVWGSDLYVGTPLGLFRYDGTKTTPVLQDRDIQALALGNSKEGEVLLVGTLTGAARLRSDGQLENLLSLGSDSVNQIVPSGRGGAFLVRSRYKQAYLPLLYLDDGSRSLTHSGLGTTWVERETRDQKSGGSRDEVYFASQHRASVKRIVLAGDGSPQYEDLPIVGPESPKDPSYAEECAAFNGVRSDGKDLWLLTGCGLYRFSEGAFSCYPPLSCSSRTRLEIQAVERFDSYLHAATSLGLLVLRPEVSIEGKIKGLFRIGDFIFIFSSRVGVDEAYYLADKVEVEFRELGMARDLDANLAVGEKEIRDGSLRFEPWQKLERPLSGLVSHVQLSLTDELGNTTRADSAYVIYLSHWLCWVALYILLPLLLCLLAMRYRPFLRVCESMSVVRIFVVVLFFSHFEWWRRALLRRYYSQVQDQVCPGAPDELIPEDAKTLRTGRWSIQVLSGSQHLGGSHAARIVGLKSHEPSAIPVLVTLPTALPVEWNSFLRQALAAQVGSLGLRSDSHLWKVVGESKSLIPLLVLSESDVALAADLAKAVRSGSLRKVGCITDSQPIVQALGILNWMDWRPLAPEAGGAQATK